MVHPKHKRLIRNSALFALAITLILSSVIAFRRWSLATSPYLYVSIKSSVNAIAKVYYDIGNGLNETDSATLTINKGEKFHALRFLLPKKPIRYIRFDPLDTGGSFSINDIGLMDKTGQLIETINLKSVKPLRQISTFIIKDYILSAATDVNAKDPMLYLDMQYPLTPKLKVNTLPFLIEIFLVFSIIFVVLWLFFMFIFANHKYILAWFKLQPKSIIVNWSQYRNNHSQTGKSFNDFVIYCGSSIIIVLLLSIFISHIINYFFLFDDYALVNVAQENSIQSIFSHAFIGFYRPLVFVFIKVQYSLFGWEVPQMYIVISITFHIINSLLLALIAGCIFKRNTMIPKLAFVLFLLSPWAGESFFWASCQFDIFATTATLLTLFFALKFTVNENSFLRQFFLMIAIIIFAMGALFAKEAYVVLPGIFVVLALYKYTPIELFKNKRFIITFILLTFCVLIYLLIRGNYITTFGGAYGNYFELIKQAKPLNMIHPLVFPPVNSWNPIIYQYGRTLFMVLFVLVTTAALLSYPRECILSFIGLSVSLIPVVSFGIGSNSTSGGRFLYLPGIFVAIILSIGICRIIKKGKTINSQNVVLNIFRIGGMVVFILYMLMSLNYQKNIWAKASNISKQCIKQFSCYIDKGSHFYISNLPYQFHQGPYIMKSYAFSYYFYNHDIKVRSESLWLNYRDGDIFIIRKEKKDLHPQFNSNPNEVLVRMNY